TSNDPPLPRGPKFLELRQEMIAYIDKVPTLPRLLAGKSYLSHQSGKWWEGHYCRCGFTEGMTHGDPQKGGRHGDAGLTIGRQGLKPVFDFIDHAVSEKKPFYIWYAPFMPHSPHNPPERLLEKYRGKTGSLHVARYWAMCEWFDETVGDLLGRLDEKGLRDNTVVVYVCDNGWIQDPDSPRYAPKSKRSPYDGGLRTPIMVRWPGKVKPRFADELAISIDLAPTILRATGLAPTPEMQGVNLLDAGAVKRRDAIFGEVFTHNAVDVHDPAANLQFRWAVEGDWKLIVPAPWNEPNAKVELYNLRDDPTEEKNLAGEHPDKVERLRRRIDAWWPAQRKSS
ncbi:MAG TPA: sulfatase-like hydrolase/transferase, partial [Gemmataceae bacterium]